MSEGYSVSLQSFFIWASRLLLELKKYAFFFKMLAIFWVWITICIRLYFPWTLVYKVSYKKCIPVNCSNVSHPFSLLQGGVGSLERGLCQSCTQWQLPLHPWNFLLSKVTFPLSFLTLNKNWRIIFWILFSKIETKKTLHSKGLEIQVGLIYLIIFYSQNFRTYRT